MSVIYMYTKPGIHLRKANKNKKPFLSNKGYPVMIFFHFLCNVSLNIITAMIVKICSDRFLKPISYINRYSLILNHKNKINCVLPLTFYGCIHRVLVDFCARYVPLHSAAPNPFYEYQRKIVFMKLGLNHSRI